MLNFELDNTFIGGNSMTWTIVMNTISHVKSNILKEDLSSQISGSDTQISGSNTNYGELYG